MKAVANGLSAGGGLSPLTAHDTQSNTSSRSGRAVSMPVVPMQQHTHLHPPRPPSAGPPTTSSTNHGEDKDSAPSVESTASGGVVPGGGSARGVTSGIGAGSLASEVSSTPCAEKSADRGTTAASGSSGKDKSFGKMSHYINELKKELDQAAWHKRESGLETQRLREKCLHLEDKLQAERSKNASLEERLEKSLSKQKQLQTQLDGVHAMATQMTPIPVTAHKQQVTTDQQRQQLTFQMPQTQHQSFQPNFPEQRSPTDSNTGIAFTPTTPTPSGSASSATIASIGGPASASMPPPVGSMPPGPSLIRVRSRDHAESTSSAAHVTPALTKVPSSPIKLNDAPQLHQPNLQQQQQQYTTALCHNSDNDQLGTYLSALVGGHDVSTASDSFQLNTITSPPASTSTTTRLANHPSGLDALDTIELPRRGMIPQSASSGALSSRGQPSQTLPSSIDVGSGVSHKRPAPARRHNSSNSIGGGTVDDIDSFIASRAVWSEGDDTVRSSRGSGNVSVSIGSSPLKR